MEPSDTLTALGFTLPTPAYIAGVLLFSLVGMVAYSAGKRSGRPLTRWLGLALMLYPYLVSETGPLFGVGLALGAAVWWSVR